MADQQKIDKIRERVKNLLRRARSVSHDGNDSVHEKMLCEERAYKLMAQYSLSEIEDEIKSEGESHRPKINNIKNTFEGGYMMTHSQRLYASIATVFGCQSVQLDTYTIDTVGRDLDLDIIEELYEQLNTYMLESLSEAQNEHRAEHGRISRSFSSSFCTGYTVEVTARLRKMYDESVGEASESTAIVLKDSKEDINKAFREKYPRTKTSRSKAKVDFSGRSAGHVAGQRADISTSGSKVSGRGTLPA